MSAPEAAVRQAHSVENAEHRPWPLLDGPWAFRITNMRVRGLPPVPRLSTSPELNVRTYVTVDGKPGVWFFTLEAASRLFVEAAKRLYRATGTLFHAAPGTLEYFLVERYCLYTADGGRLYRAGIHHPPWGLQRGDAAIARNTLSPVALPDDDWSLREV